MCAQTYLAADIGSSSIKLVCGAAAGHKLEIKEYDIIETPPNSIKDGKIIQIQAVAGAIKEAVKRSRLSGQKLILNITGTGVITRDIQVPRSTDDEIKKMLEFEAQQYFPVDLESYSLDFKVLEELDSGEGSFTRVLLAAVPLKQVEEYMKLSQLLKMEIAAIDIPANSISKLLFGDGRDYKPHFSALPGEFAFIDLGAETTGVCIFSEGKLNFSRILLNGSSDIDRALAEQYEMDFKWGERQKKGKIKLLTEAEDEDGLDQERHYNSIARRTLDHIFEDINRLFEFYNSRGKGARLQKLVITGGGSRLKELCGYMSGYFGMPVEPFQPEKSILYKGRKKREQFLEDFALLGGSPGLLVRRK